MAVKYTNKHNLPQEFVDAMMLDNHTVNGDISVTTLIDSPQVRQLKRTSDYEIDLSEMMAMFFGTAIHERLESSNPKAHQSKIMNLCAKILSDTGSEQEIKVADWIRKKSAKLLSEANQDVLIEQTLTLDIDGTILSGTLDRYFKDTKTIRDYKTITASQLMFPEQKESWYLQQNIYACMLRVAGYEVEKIEICAIVKDWSKLKVSSGQDYPKSPFVTIPIVVADHDKVMEYIKKRVAIHRRAEEGESVPCTKKDRWAKEDTYAVRKKGGKRSMKNFDSEAMAKNFIEENSFKHAPGDLYVEYRPSESFRCKNGYCPVPSVCPQYQKELEILASVSAETF